METMEVLEAIQTLHGLTFNTYGRLAVVSVLSKGDLLDILIRLVQVCSLGCLISYPPVSEASREVVNLIERKNPHTRVS